MTVHEAALSFSSRWLREIGAFRDDALACLGTGRCHRARGALACGTSAGPSGFAVLNRRGEYTGLCSDIRRAIAAALPGGVNKVRFVTTTSANRLTALRKGGIDILSFNTTRAQPRMVSYFHAGLRPRVPGKP